MKEKIMAYEAPKTESLVVRFEGTILQASRLGSSGFGEKGNVRDNDNTGWGW